jgi:hypothetical protein
VEKQGEADYSGTNHPDTDAPHAVHVPDGIIKKGAWLEVKTGGSLLRMAETVGSLLNAVSRNVRTALRSHPRGWEKSV